MLWGWDELRGSLVNDLGALNKVEIGNWSWCELLKVEPLDQPNATLDPLMDAVAPVVSDARSVEALERAYQRDVRLQPPVTLLYKRA